MAATIKAIQNLHFERSNLRQVDKVEQSEADKVIRSALNGAPRIDFVSRGKVVSVTVFLL